MRPSPELEDIESETNSNGFFPISQIYPKLSYSAIPHFLNSLMIEVVKKILFILALLLCPLSGLGQTGAIQGTSTLGGISATTQGAQSSNKLLGVIPAAKISIYLTGTQTLATLTSDGTHSLSNPFYSNASNAVNPGGYIAFVSTNIGYDVVASSGQGTPNCTTGPMCYTQPVTLCKDCFASSQFIVPTTGCDVNSPNDCVITDPTGSQLITQPGNTQFGAKDATLDEFLFTANGNLKYPEFYGQLSKNDGIHTPFSSTDHYATFDFNYGGLDISMNPPVNSGAQYAHAFNIDNSGFDMQLPSVSIQTDPGGDIQLTCGFGPSGPNNCSVELTSNITFAGGGGGPSGICGNDGKICANTTLDWTSSNHGGYTVFNLDATSAPFTVTLGAASGPSFDLATTLWFFKEDATSNAITLTAGAGDTINGLASISIATPYQMVQLMSDGVHAWYVNGLATGGGGLLGMTAGQVPIAATATTVTSSKALAGSGAGITTGPTSSTNLDCAQFSGTTGQIADAGAPCGTSTIPSQYKTWSCQPGLGDGLNAITAGTYLQSTCKNTTGVTVTLTGLQCFTDNSGSSTMNASGNTLGALLTGAVTCSSSFASGAQSANVLLTNGDYIKFTFVADGSSKQATFVVTGTY